MKDNNHLDDLFLSKLKDFEQEPPPYVWDRILETQQAQKRRKLFIYFKVAGIAAAILLAFLFGWQLKQGQRNLLPVLTENAQEIQRKEKNTPAIKENETIDGNLRDEQMPEQEQISSELAGPSEKKQTEKDNNKVRNENFVVAMTVANNNDALISREQSEKDITENRKQKTEQFQLLRLLSIRLNDSFNSRQLAKNRDKKSERLSPLELSVINENAKLLADNRADKKPGAWQVGAMLTPGYAVSQSSQTQEYASNMVVPGSKEDLQMGGGVSVEYKTKKRWSVQSGVYYNKLGQTSSNQDLNSFDGAYAVVGEGFTTVDAAYFNTSVDVKSGELLLNTPAGVVAIDNLPSNARLSNGFESLAKNDGILLNQTEFEQNFEYIEIPLILRYQLIDAAFDVQLLGGFNASMLVANNAYAKDLTGRERIGETRDMNTVNYGTSIGFGLGYGLTDKISIRVEPQLKYFLGSLNSNSNVNFKPYTIGVYTGLSYQF